VRYGRSTFPISGQSKHFIDKLTRRDNAGAADVSQSQQSPFVASDKIVDFSADSGCQDRIIIRIG
jgi:hypothetical protein